MVSLGDTAFPSFWIGRFQLHQEEEKKPVHWRTAPWHREAPSKKQDARSDRFCQVGHLRFFCARRFCERQELVRSCVCCFRSEAKLFHLHGACRVDSRGSECESCKYDHRKVELISLVEKRPRARSELCHFIADQIPEPLRFSCAHVDLGHAGLPRSAKKS